MLDYTENIVKMLTNNNLTLALCESATGGMVSSLLVNVPHVSKVFKGSIVSYTNEIKINVAHVNKQIIEK